MTDIKWYYALTVFQLILFSYGMGFVFCLSTTWHHHNNKFIYRTIIASKKQKQDAIKILHSHQSFMQYSSILLLFPFYIWPHRLNCVQTSKTQRSRFHFVVRANLVCWFRDVLGVFYWAEIVQEEPEGNLEINWRISLYIYRCLKEKTRRCQGKRYRVFRKKWGLFVESVTEFSVVQRRPNKDGF